MDENKQKSLYDFKNNCDEDLSKENDAKEWCDESKKFSCGVNLEDWSFG